MGLFSRFWFWLRQLLFPHLCCLCQKVIAKPGLCSQCRNSFTVAVPPLCTRCGGRCDSILSICSHCLAAHRAWDQGWTIWRYGQGVATAIKDYKYHDKTYWARYFGEHMAQKLATVADLPDCITYIPLHWFRHLHRGYNQSQEVAETLSSHLNIPCKRILVRVKLTRQQAGLRRRERLKNLKRAFKVRSGKADYVKDRHILLIDDVLTTGATLQAAAIELKRAGARKISIICIARG